MNFFRGILYALPMGLLIWAVILLFVNIVIRVTW